MNKNIGSKIVSAIKNVFYFEKSCDVICLIQKNITCKLFNCLACYPLLMHIVRIMCACVTLQTEHPQGSLSNAWKRMISNQRKRAVVACFRMVPLYGIPRYTGQMQKISFAAKNYSGRECARGKNDKKHSK